MRSRHHRRRLIWHRRSSAANVAAGKPSEAPTILRRIGFAVAIAMLATALAPTGAGAAHPAKKDHAEAAAHTHKGKGANTSASTAHVKNHGKPRGHPHRVVHGPDYHPPYADIVVDGNSGGVLHETDPDSPRHPASLTKIMTLYLLFEQLERGALQLNSQLPVSAYAASQSPTKLGLKANSTITVDDAIKGLVTRSANDAAVVIAEAIAGSESDFAALMTQKAERLGMGHTVYVNASGLPADAQVTTARDQALLGRAIQDRFPNYYGYFATPSFHYHGADISNHNALLREVEGVDGIKTGYTEASGYNLVCSVRRASRHLVAVVLGGRSNAARDARMRQLIEETLGAAATERTAPPVVEGTTPTGMQQGFAPASVRDLPQNIP